MNFKLALVFAASALALHATALTGNTALITTTTDTESSGLHTEGSGQFTFNPPASGTVIGLGNLTSFDFTLIETNRYYPTLIPPEEFDIPLSNIEEFSFDTSNVDSLVLKALIQNYPDAGTGVYNTLMIQPGDSMFVYPEVAFVGGGYGPADPASASAPEPNGMTIIAGILLVGIGIRQRRKQKAKHL